MSRIRVTRTIIYEGDSTWVNETLARSAIQIGEHVGYQVELPGSNRIYESQRVEEVLEYDAGPGPQKEGWKRE